LTQVKLGVGLGVSDVASDGLGVSEADDVSVVAGVTLGLDVSEADDVSVVAGVTLGLGTDVVGCGVGVQPGTVVGVPVGVGVFADEVEGLERGTGLTLRVLDELGGDGLRRGAGLLVTRQQDGGRCNPGILACTAGVVGKLAAADAGCCFWPLPWLPATGVGVVGDVLKLSCRDNQVPPNTTRASRTARPMEVNDLGWSRTADH
jgi:hypothetical protein